MEKQEILDLLGHYWLNREEINKIKDEISKNFSNDADVMLKALGISMSFLDLADETLLKDENFLIAVIKRKPKYIKEIAEKVFIFNENFFIKLVTEIPTILEEILYYSKHLQKFNFRFYDQEVEEYFNNPLLNDNEQFMLSCLKKNWKFITLASKRLKDKDDFILAAIQIYPRTLECASTRLRNSREFIEKAVKIKSKIVLNYAGEDLKNDEELVFLSNLNYSDLLDKLKLKYYDDYFAKVVCKDVTKDNWLDFYKTMILSNVLPKIYSSPDYSIYDINFVESEATFNLFDSKTQESLRNRIKEIKTKNRQDAIIIFNAFAKCENDKNKIEELLQKNNLTSDKIINFILNNKYLDKLQKNSLLGIMYQVYDISKIVRVADIFELLEEMETKKLTITDILKEKNIDKKEFYRIYDEAKKNNPLLFNYIKDSLELNKIRGFRKFISKGYIILNSKFKTILEYELAYKINIYEFIESYYGTELYDKLLGKFSIMTDFNFSNLTPSKAQIKA